MGPGAQPSVVVGLALSLPLAAQTDVKIELWGAQDGVALAGSTVGLRLASGKPGALVGLFAYRGGGREHAIPAQVLFDIALTDRNGNLEREYLIPDSFTSGSATVYALIWDGKMPCETRHITLSFAAPVPTQEPANRNRAAPRPHDEVEGDVPQEPANRDRAAPRPYEEVEGDVPETA